MGRLGSVIGEGLRKFFYLLAFFYVRVNGKVYMDGISGALPLVSDLPGCGRWGFASLGSLLYGKKGPVVVLIGTVSGAREFAKLFCEGLCDCRAVYAVGADVREVLSGVLAMGEAMRRPGLIAVWSAVARGESVPAFAHLFLYLFWVCLWVVFFYVGYFFPTDDLLRHAVSYKWGYD